MDRLDAVVLDPHQIWLDAIEMVLSRIGARIVTKTASADEALTAVAAHKPRLLTLELETMPGNPDGFEVIRQARTLVPSIRAIVLSAHQDTFHIDGALAAGAAAYVVKTAHPDDIASAVHQAFQHSVYLATPATGAGQAETAGGPAAPEAPAGLTRREIEILRMVADGQSNAQVARTLWVTEQTVKFHLSNIYRKLGVANRTEASRWAQLNGLSENSHEPTFSA
jgi:DNA-binding NarL/FixJ family response regulator